MKRKALIIVSPLHQSEKLDFRKSVMTDLTNQTNFLKSAIGGAWRTDEIFTFVDPTKQEVLEHLYTLSSYDYSYIYFAGHGDNFESIDRIILNDSHEHLEIPQLCENSGSKRIVIIDACRSYSTFSNMSGLGSLSFSHTNIPKSRVIFDQAMSTSKDGTVLIQSSSEGESSIGYPTGGYFSTNFLTAINKLSKISKKPIINIVEVFNVAFQSTQNKHLPEFKSIGNYNLPIGIKEQKLLPVISKPQKKSWGFAEYATTAVLGTLGAVVIYKMFKD